jgi:hypothetical protein
MSKIKTPILIILFNRVEIAKELFLSLQKIKPPRLYIYFDGPREKFKEADLNAFSKIEELVVEIINWECEVNIEHSEKNRGSHISPKRAIDWFFSYEQDGIILEDDCIPDPSFYSYCNFLLQKYKNNNNVFLISGDNGGPVLGPEIFMGNDYLFSKVPLTWGWATWKSRWEKLDENLDNWNTTFFKNRQFLNSYPLYESLLIYNMLNRVSSRKEKNWDYLVYSTMLKNNYLSIIPKNNLIKNIGWGSNATHTKITNFRSYFPTKEMKSFNFVGPISNSRRIDIIISYMVHFGIALSSEKIMPLIGARIRHFLRRTKYYVTILLIKIKKLLTLINSIL